MNGSRDLDRFVAAQEAGGTYAAALAELRRGRKTTHWMWFVLPQLAGLGRSATSVRYAIRSLDEAGAYLAHPLLGARLRETAEVIAASAAPTADALLGSIDAVKLRSSMTLFVHASAHEPVFARVLDRYFEGIEDAATVDLLRASGEVGPAR